MSLAYPNTHYRCNYKQPPYTITTIQLNFELHAQHTIVTARSLVKQLDPSSCALRLDGENLILHRLDIDGQLWPHYQLVTGALIVEKVPKIFYLTIVTEISPTNNTSLTGLYQSGDTLCTQCESEGFRRITYYLDRPDVLALFNTKIIASMQDYPQLLSNGNREAQGQLDDGRHWVQWNDPFPKPCYLFALVAGNFTCLQDSFITRSGRKIMLECYVEHGKLNRTDWAMLCLKQAMKWDEVRFGLEYDLDIYMIIAVSFFNMGAMENKGLNIFNEKCLLADQQTATDNDHYRIKSIVAHEYFHNWTGNRITCRDWFQLSLKEGLTVFREQEFMADHGAHTSYRIDSAIYMRSTQFLEDAGPMAHPIRPETFMEINNFYTPTVYEKGAEVVRMLYTLVGKELFALGMQLYVQRHDGQAVTCDDFLQAMSDASGYDLTQFALWYSQSGTPVVIIFDHYDRIQQQYTLVVTQHTPPTIDQAVKLPLQIPLAVALYDVEGREIPLQHEGELTTQIININKEKQTLIFEKIPQHPIPSFLLQFSAPVKLDYPYNEDQLIFLVHKAKDPFARWDAVQTLINRQVIQAVDHYPKTWKISYTFINSFEQLMQDEKTDFALKVRLLTLPTEKQLAELFTVIDPLAIHVARQNICSQIADLLYPILFASYHKYEIKNVIDSDSMHQRALRNTCLYYLAFAKTIDTNFTTDSINQLVESHYLHADNMTDQLAAINIAVSAQLPCNTALLQFFEQKWEQDTLIMDKWFALQAIRPQTNLVEQMELLIQHRCFCLTNPNRVYSLIGTFCNDNPAIFHNKLGDGYNFLYRIICKLNISNPQLAARLIDPLICFKRYKKEYSLLMQQTLNKLSELPNLSRDLYEKIAYALKHRTC